jgi:alcohol dehydrogenase, propanol-preferring
MATSMKAAVVRQFGQPLSIDQLPVAEPGFGQVLIK